MGPRRLFTLTVSALLLAGCGDDLSGTEWTSDDGLRVLYLHDGDAADWNDLFEVEDGDGDTYVVRVVWSGTWEVTDDDLVYLQLTCSTDAPDEGFSCPEVESEARVRVVCSQVSEVELSCSHGGRDTRLKLSGDP